VYQWQINNAGNWTDIPGANSPEYTDSLPADNAQYRLLVSSSSVNLSLDNCRVESQVMTLKKRPALQPLLQSVNIDCFAAGNGSANLESVTGIPPFSVLWSNADTSGQINNLTPGLYTVTLTDSKGCTGVSIGRNYRASCAGCTRQCGRRFLLRTEQRFSPGIRRWRHPALLLSLEHRQRHLSIG
jgi:hypothetical protein